MIAAHLFESLEIQLPEGVQNIEVLKVTCDSRKCEPGVVFVAIKGVSLDGFEYIDDAISRGVQIIVTDRSTDPRNKINLVLVENARSAYARLNKILWLGSECGLKLIGITGTNGKTSTSYILQHLLGGRDHCGLLGTIRCEGGSVSLPSTHTTPDPETLYPLLRRMYDDGCQYVVMEASSHALDQGRLEGLWFDVGIFTNFTQDHLDYHETMENYLAAKLKITEMLRNGSHLIYNNDDLKLREVPCFTNKNRFISIGKTDFSDAHVLILQSHLAGSRFCLKYQTNEAVLSTMMVGEHNVMNASMAVLAGMLLGKNIQTLSQSLAVFSGVDGRVDRLETNRDFHVYIDYAHTDDGLRNVLKSIKPLVAGRLLLLFGCGGDRDKGKRPLMAKVAEEYADYVVLTSDNPRSESPSQIIKDIEAGFTPAFQQYVIQKDRKKAIRTILLHVRSKDVVIIAGKGHETYQIIEGHKYAFSDKEECLKILQGL